jgi:DNA-directed RNA polymerase subunit M/transcription elongation factor TFIIS
MQDIEIKIDLGLKGALVGYREERVMEIRGAVVDKVRRLINEQSNKTDDIDLAVDIEKGVFNASIFSANDSDITPSWDNPLFVSFYKQNAKMVIVNLDKNSYVNTGSKHENHILKRILDGDVRAIDLGSMRPEDISPLKWGKMMESRIKRQQNMEQYKEGAKTDMFKCFRCMKRECTYTTAQIRSADEPETIFVRCVVCDNKWRIG